MVRGILNELKAAEQLILIVGLLIALVWFVTKTQSVVAPNPNASGPLGLVPKSITDVLHQSLGDFSVRPTAQDTWWTPGDTAMVNKIVDRIKSFFGFGGASKNASPAGNSIDGAPLTGQALADYDATSARNQSLLNYLNFEGQPWSQEAGSEAGYNPTGVGV